MPKILVSPGGIHAPTTVVLPDRLGLSFSYLGHIGVVSLEKGRFTALYINPGTRGEVAIARNLFGVNTWRQIEACYRRSPLRDERITMSAADYEEFKTKLLADATNAYEGEVDDLHPRRDPKRRRR